MGAVKGTCLSEPIAITGMACRYPGAESVSALWRVLVGREEHIREIPRERWNGDDYLDPDPSRLGRSITKWGGFLNGIEEFDAAFFGISPREAPHVDPRQRLI